MNAKSSLTKNYEEVKLSQLQASFETLREIYKTSLQFITIAAGAEILFFTLSIQYKSIGLLAISGLILVILIYQLKLSGRSFSSVLFTAFSLEKELDLVGQQSLVTSFMVSILGIKRLEEFILDTSNMNEENLIENWSKYSRKYSPFESGFTSALATTIGVIQIVAAFLLLIFGWT